MLHHSTGYRKPELKVVSKETIGNPGVSKPLNFERSETPKVYQGNKPQMQVNSPPVKFVYDTPKKTQNQEIEQRSARKQYYEEK